MNFKAKRLLFRAGEQSRSAGPIAGGLRTAALAALAVAALQPSTANAAQLATFEGLSTAAQVGDYVGLSWTAFIPTTNFPNGVVSPTQAAYNPFGQMAVISGFDPFTFNSGYFTALNNDGMTVLARALQGGLWIEKQFTISAAGPHFELFDWTNVTRVEFRGRGGAGNPTTPRRILFDDLLFNAPLTPPPTEPPIDPIPEPSTWALMILGFGAVGSMLRRRRSAALA